MSYLERLLEGVQVDWKSLGEVVDMRAGQHISASKISQTQNSEYPYPCFGGNGIRGYVVKNSHRGTHLLIGRQGALCGNVQRFNGIFYATEHAIVVTSKGEINIGFAFHLLTLMNLNQYASKSAQPGLAVGRLETLKIPIPPLSVQKEIARILDKFTELTAELTAELAARKEQYAYYREQLFDFDEQGVGKERLGIVGEFQRGKRFVKDDMISEGVPCIHYGEMYTYYGTWANKSKSFLSQELVKHKNLRVAEKGDVVIVAAGETIEDIGMGTAWLGNEGVVIHDACFSYRSPLNPKYVAYFTRTKQFHDQIKKHISSGKISAINAKGLEKVLIPVPSPEEQERIVAILDKFDILTTSISGGLPKEVELREKQYEYYRELLLMFPKNNIES